MINFLRKYIAKYKNRTLFLTTNSTVIHPEAKIVNLRKDKKLIQIGENTHIRGELFTFTHGGEIFIGEYCYIGEKTKIWSAGSVKIGDRVLIGHNVNIFDNNTHPINPYERHQHFKDIITTGFPQISDLQEEPVTICDDVFIGCMSIILKGVKIGEGAIVGAGSVVAEDVPPWVIISGNPAKIVRELTEDERTGSYPNSK